MSRPPGSPRRRWRFAALAVVASAIAVVTLTPSYPLEPGELTGCVLCGQRWLADLLRNVILFVPFGAALASMQAPGSARRAALLASLFSALIELAQLSIPGRDPSVGDLVANTLGGILGVVAMATLSRWTAPTTRAAGPLALGAAIAFGATIGLTGLLWHPSLPPSTYFTQWTPDLAHLEAYQGRVLSASLGKHPLVPEVRATPAEIAAFLPGQASGDAYPPATHAGPELRIDAIASTPPGTLAPVLAIHDQLGREILLLGADRGDLVVRFRTRATALALDQPDIRVRSVISGVADGDRLTIGVRVGNEGAWCITVDAATSCKHGFAAGSGWATLLFPRLRPAWAQRLLDGIWLAVLAFPVGLWSRRGATSAAALAIVAASLWVVPEWVGLRSAAPSEILAVAAGLGIAAAFARRMRRPARAPAA